MQSSVLLLHSSQATKWQQGRNNVCTRVCFHFRQVISERNRPFSLSALLCLQHTHPQQYVLCNAFAFQHYSMSSSQTQRRNDDSRDMHKFLLIFSHQTKESTIVTLHLPWRFPWRHFNTLPRSYISLCFPWRFLRGTGLGIMLPVTHSMTAFP